MNIFTLARFILPRSRKWRKVRNEFLTDFPRCAACDGAARLEVHHVLPVHMRPDLELEKSNLITLCESLMTCHFRVGHLGSWLRYNPDVRRDAGRQLIRILKDRAR